MRRKTPALRVAIPLPRLNGGLVSNVVLVASVAAFCTALSFLTDWRWGVMTAGVIGFATVIYLQSLGVIADDSEPDPPAPPVKAVPAAKKAA